MKRWFYSLEKSSRVKYVVSEWDVPDHKLGTLAEYFDIAFPCQHRAAGDAIVTGKLFLELVKKKQSLL